MFLYPIKYLPVITALLLLIVPAQANSIPIPNNSFEVPVIDPNGGFPAIPFVSSWNEDDIDPLSRNTGTFFNTPPDSPDHLFNVDGNQLAFLGSMEGNAFWQYLPQTYKAGKSYRLTVGICISMRFPPPEGTPLILALQYLPGADPNDVVSIASVQAPAPDPNSRIVEDFSVILPAVQSTDPWAGKNISVAIRATGAAGGFWDVDNVRLMEYPRTPEFTDDSFVNLKDFAKMAAEWQSCTEPQTDVTGDGCVNAEDLMILIEYWLSDV
jgi:hypothetical protein